MLSADPIAFTIEVEEDVAGGPPGGALSTGPATSTTDVEDDKVSIPPCVQILIGSCKVKHRK
jgi:hypothetical protein